MKSYLSLIPISAKVHKRRNRMTLFCIILAVFLVTAIFSMVDMGIRAQKTDSINRHGNWHIILENIPEDDAQRMRSRSDVAAVSHYAAVNGEINEDYYIGEKKAMLCGIDESFIGDIMNCFTPDSYPQNEKQIILTPNAKTILGVSAGDTVTVNTPSGSYDYMISGFSSNHPYDDITFIMEQDAIGAFMNMTAFKEMSRHEPDEADNSVYYVQFKNHANIKKAVRDIKQQYGLADEHITQNTVLIGLTGFSDNAYVSQFYLIAAILFILILIAGILMITGSINSNIAERLQFFGMLRCIGASREQIIRFVRLEALNWCKTAVPIGTILGIIITWGLCAVLRFFIGGEFSDMPIWGISCIGIVCGIIVGILTVLLAAQSPAKRAAKVSPMTAVSGRASGTKKIRHAVNTRFFHIETALGIHHAVSAKKNFILMTGSFALSIILFLSFSVILQFTCRLIPQLRPYTPDLSIMSGDRSCSVDRELITEISGKSDVKRVFGRMYKGGIPAEFSGRRNTIDLISYEKYQLNWAKKDIIDGDLSKIYGSNNYVLTVYDKTNPLKTGDKIQLDGTEVEVAGVLSTSPFDNTEGTPTVLCSEETFTRLTGERDYAIIDVQMTNGATDEDADIIRNLAGSTYMFSDRRMTNREATGTYWAFRLLVYGFLAIIAMITVFNIINIISMSVSARIKQYGAMRAVGMDLLQVQKMIAAEAGVYALSGCLAGCALGIPLNRLLFHRLISAYFGDIWTVPIAPIVIILLIVFAASAAAVYSPVKRIKHMAVTDTINEL